MLNLQQMHHAIPYYIIRMIIVIYNYIFDTRNVRAGVTERAISACVCVCFRVIDDLTASNGITFYLSVYFSSNKWKLEQINKNVRIVKQINNMKHKHSAVAVLSNARL